MDDKNLLRKNFKILRKELDITSKSQILCNKLREKEFYKMAKNILIFYPKEFEINTLDLLKDDKNFFLPRVNGKNLEICPYFAGDKLKDSDFGVLEPICESINTNIIELAIVPALSADKDNYRLGYGGGFYDRFLMENPSIKSVVLLPQELFVDKLPREEFDTPTDYVILG